MSVAQGITPDSLELGGGATLLYVGARGARRGEFSSAPM
jgi:hypothetical protein